MRLFSRILFAFSILILVSCQNDQTAEAPTTTAPVQQRPVPSFDRDSAYAYVAKQLDFGPRVPNTEAHVACKDWMVSKLKSFGADVIEQSFQVTAYTGDVLNATNVIAQFNKENKNRVVLAAHWDSRPFADSPLNKERRDEPVMGADDGASGTGILMEIARQLGSNPLDLGVDIILFDVEDYGEDSDDPDKDTRYTWGLGSQYWSRNFHVEPYFKPKFGILLDMVGSENARFPYEGVSMEYAPRVVEKVWKLAGQMGYENYFVKERDRGITDDHYFLNINDVNHRNFSNCIHK
ncbi:MAG: M28 family peptidase, partial [Bacteroidota bacterium]